MAVAQICEACFHSYRCDGSVRICCNAPKSSISSWEIFFREITKKTGPTDGDVVIYQFKFPCLITCQPEHYLLVTQMSLKKLKQRNTKMTVYFVLSS